MKSKFPAEYIVEKDKKRLHLCLKHTQNEIGVIKHDMKPLPKDSDISCSECAAEFVNN